MDVRLSPEQAALRDAAAQVVDRLGVHGVAELDDRARAAKLDAAVAASGWRELRTATDDGTPWASAVEVSLVADALATYKRLHHVVLVEVVPRTPSGKVLRRTLRDEWTATLATGRPD